jgi:hypothetical protein
MEIHQWRISTSALPSHRLLSAGCSPLLTQRGRWIAPSPSQLDEGLAQAGREFLGATISYDEVTTDETRRACNYLGQMKVNQKAVESVTELNDLVNQRVHHGISRDNNPV